MLRKLGFLFLLSFLFLAGGFGFGSPSHAEESLPVVSLADFAPGASWTWDYVKEGHGPWATERYTVVSRVGSVVMFEISSDYGGGQNLKPNTRLEVDVAKCLAAYRNPVKRSAWSFKMFSIVQTPTGPVWEPYEAPSTLAFEEKFNCNPHIYSKASAPYLTVYSKFDGVAVFQQKLWRRLNASWFAQEGQFRAIAFHKEFTSDPAQAYSFTLRH